MTGVVAIAPSEGRRGSSRAKWDRQNKKQFLMNRSIHFFNVIFTAILWPNNNQILVEFKSFGKDFPAIVLGRA